MGSGVVTRLSKATDDARARLNAPHALRSEGAAGAGRCEAIAVPPAGASTPGRGAGVAARRGRDRGPPAEVLAPLSRARGLSSGPWLSEGGRTRGPKFGLVRGKVMSKEYTVFIQAHSV